MKTKTILLIDSQVIVRRTLARILRDHTDFNLKVCADPQMALDYIPQLKPDLLLLGIRTGVVEELALLSTLRIRYPDLKIILLSERSREGAAIAVAGLRLGIFDIITKPASERSLLFADRHLSKRVVPIVNAALQDSGQTDWRGVTRHLKLLDEYGNSPDPQVPPKLLVLGGSTGSPAALFPLLSTLPEEFPVPIVIALHFPGTFTEILAANLDAGSKLSVREGDNGTKVEPGKVLLAKGGYHCEFQHTGRSLRLRVHRGPREMGMRPSINLLFRSAASVLGSDVTALVLSGCADEGLDGYKAIYRAGGQVLIQSPWETAVSHLPISVLNAGYCNGSFTISSADKLWQELSSRKHRANRTFADRHSAIAGGQGAGGSLRTEYHLFNPPPERADWDNS